MSDIVLKQKAARKSILLSFADEAAAPLVGLAVVVQEPGVALPRTGTTDGSGDVTLTVYPGSTNVLSVTDDRLPTPYRATLVVRSDGTHTIQ